jgi:lysophospholipase L1-like esterase
MKQCVLILSLALLMGFTQSSGNKTRIFIAGDSTAQSYNEKRDGLIKGWGQMLALFFNEDVEVINYAIGGRSTNSYIREGRWDRLISEVKAGDYVLIQFGHNDASTRPERHTSYEEYERNLVRMIGEVREKQATPVLLTSVVMRTFVNGHLTDDRLKGYPVITRRVAKEQDAPMIDINLRTKDFVTMLGDEDSKPYYRWVEPGEDPTKPEGLKDDTHMMEKGASQVARFVAEGIMELNLPGLGEKVKREE